MAFTNLWLKKILDQIQVDDLVLNETRKRRDAVLDAARQIKGALRAFGSGSVAHGTVIQPVSDADGGGVLDRRSYPELGPDGGGIGPRDVVPSARDFILTKVRLSYPNAQAEITKRAIKITFNQPLKSGTDPSVDIVIALTRDGKPGLWIPNTEDDSWDASDPEKHTQLLTEGDNDTRVLRARTIRLSKAWNKKYSDPALSSFNIEALALSAIKDIVPIEHALLGFFEYSAGDLSKRLTPDPAGVSDPIKCPNRQLAVLRLQTAAHAMKEAIDNDDNEEKVLAALSRVFGDLVEVPTSDSKDGLADSIRKGLVGYEAGKISTKPSSPKAKKVVSHGSPR